ncbi:MAG: ParB/RepB/Spo0J family partition protein [Candidatus Sungbacteria bacterium]|uniref:ParB/RepB/Spo0J family partition protein n=1 Tax=Candidatus Sungiibacteriota bacterium TaxID=2750080 RepID=A0A932YYT4_9BACT|nr:ParB/RepB/Spo0J family partition protein [Candidatus Sungbacteria bacterium]
MKDDAGYVPTKYDSVFWIDVERIQPNPHQPRKEFSEAGLNSLAESIRQYGVLQPLVVSRTDVEKPDGLESVYELIAGERRLRASRLAGLRQVPVVIRQGESNLTKLELAIIENIQREDLNAIDRAKALQKLIDEFGISHAECAAKIGRSREYVSNSLRLLSLPEHMQDSIVMKEISEGHARPLMALNDRPEERETLFKEIILRKLNVRSAERIARSIAQERVHKYNRKSAEMVELEKSLTETLGTRVIIETNAEGGCLRIDFFSPDDLQQLVDALAAEREAEAPAPNSLQIFPNTTQISDLPAQAGDPVPPAAPEEPSEDELYAVSKFTV